MFLLATAVGLVSTRTTVVPECGAPLVLCGA